MIGVKLDPERARETHERVEGRAVFGGFEA
jgi:hypothetical protein